MSYVLIVLTLVTLYTSSFAQPCKIEGRITNKSTQQGLSYANVKADNTSKGMSANINGYYEFYLPQGTYRLISSCIGFQSDTITISVNADKKNVNFSLIPVAIHVPGITVLPGKNPAIEIIRNAIINKAKRAEHLTSYEFDAFTKGIVRSNNDFDFSSRSISMGLSKAKESAKLLTKSQDSTLMNIKGIFENQSKGFFKKPDYYKEQIAARKTSSNLPQSVSALTGGRLIQNFYNEDIKFFDRLIPGPLAQNALDYYYFRIDDTLAIDNIKVYKIYFEPDKISDPGFIGYIFITDSTYNLLKVDADLNRAANTGGFFERVNVFQQFLPYGPNIYMPIDYRIFIKTSVLGFLKGNFELSSIMYNYKINEFIGDDFFDKAVLTILPGADSKDSLYWSKIQSIPNTREEISAYRKIDSIRSLPHNIWDKLFSNLMSGQYELNNNYSISGPFGIYQFNRVEGHTLYFSAYGHNFYNKRLDTRITLSNGFSDKKMKERFSANYYLGDFRTYKFSFDGFNRLASLFSSSDEYSSFTSTVLSLISRRGFRNYYYTKGFELGFQGEVIPILSLSATYINHTDNSAVNNSDFALFAGGRNRTMVENTPVYATRINAMNLGFNFDFRNYIEDGFSRKRISQGNSYATFGGGAFISNSKILKSKIDFISYNFNVQGVLNTYKSASLGFKLNGVFSNGPVPFQLQYALPGNISATGKSFTFRSVGLNDVFGDQVLAFNLEHNFRDEFFRLLGVPFISNLHLQFNTFFNAAWKNMSPKSAAIMPVGYSILNQPLFEAGFSLGHLMLPLSLEFAWRLTHTDRGGFRIGINTFLL